MFCFRGMLFRIVPKPRKQSFQELANKNKKKNYNAIFSLYNFLKEQILKI